MVCQRGGGERPYTYIYIYICLSARPLLTTDRDIDTVYSWEVNGGDSAEIGSCDMQPLNKNAAKLLVCYNV